MPKRFHDTNIWGEDWFIEMPKDYQQFFFYFKDHVDHAGVWRPNVATFNKIFSSAVDLKTALSFFNKDQVRISVLKNGRWLFLGFIQFQYGQNLNHNNRVHKSILDVLSVNGVNLTSKLPQIRVIDTLKDKDKDIDKDIKKEGGAGGGRSSARKARPPHFEECTCKECR